MDASKDHVELLQGTVDLIVLRAYSITKAGEKALVKQAERWRRLAGLVDKLLLES